MSFNVVTNTQQESSDRPQVDWKALNEYVVETAQLQQPETLVGVISSVVDLGIQPQKPAEYVFEGDESAEREEIANNPNVSFETRERFYDDGKWLNDVRVKVVPRKDTQCIAMTVDFPEIQINKGQYFGDDSGKTLPLRMLLGGEFKPSKESPVIVAKPFPLTVRKNDKTNNEWSMTFNSTLYQMAVAAKITEKGKPFLPQDVDKLLGKAFQFEAQIGFNDKGYYFEKVSFKAALGRGMVVPEFDESILHMIQFTAQNEESAVKQLRASIKNTIKRATNYESSVIAQQLGDSGSLQVPSEPAKPSGDTNAQVAQQSAPKAAVETVDEFADFDDDIPF